jgi:predicted ArsR family transcriptional regulator
MYTEKCGASSRYHRLVAQWTFLSNHAHVLMCVAQNPNVRLRDVATLVGITERAAQRIVTELEEEGYLEREREGRRNSYRLNTTMPLRHPLDSDHQIGELLTAFGVRLATDPDGVSRTQS